MLRFVRASTLAVVVVMGCSSSPSVPSDAGPVSDGGALEARRLELESERSVTLRSGDETIILVRYLDEAGRPLAGQSVRFLLDGVAHDSSLVALDDVTDASGRASATLVAGATPAAFRVRVSAAEATPLSIDVAVSDAGFGELEVTLEYDGARDDGVLAAAVFAGASCDDPRTQAERGDRYRLRGPDDDDITFVGLPAGLSYAVAGRVEGAGGALLGWGCLDGVTVSPDVLRRVTVVVQDLPIAAEGTYEGSLAFDAPATAEAVAEEMSAFGDAFLAPGATSALLDAMERQLVDDEPALISLRAARASDLDERYEATLDASDVGPSAALAALTTFVESRLAALHLFGTWRIADGELAGRFVRIVGGTEDTTDVALGAAFALQGTGAIDPSGLVEGLRISFPLDRVIAHLLTTEASALGLTRRDELLADLAGCDALPELPDVDVCDGACRVAACREVTSVLWTGLELHLSAITPARTSLTLDGQLVLEETSGDRAVDGLRGVLTGVWGSSSAVSPEAIEAEVDGTRAIP